MRIKGCQPSAEGRGPPASGSLFEMAQLFKLFICVLSLVFLSLSAPNSAIGAKCPSKVKEIIAPPRGWIQGKPAPSDHILELRIALPMSNFHVLEQHLYEISDPYHERYGQHLSKEQVEELVSPYPETISLVNEWLVSHGLNENDFVRSPAKDWVTVRVPVELAETMLNTVN